MRWYPIFVISWAKHDRKSKYDCQPPRSKGCRWYLTQHLPRTPVLNEGHALCHSPCVFIFYCPSPPIFQTHKGRDFFCWLLDPQVLNRYLWKTEKKGKKGRRKKSIFMGPLLRVLHITLSVAPFTWTYQEEESPGSPDLRQTQHVALVVLKRICHQQFGFYIKRKNKHLSSKVAEARIKVESTSLSNCQNPTLLKCNKTESILKWIKCCFSPVTTI